MSRPSILIVDDQASVRTYTRHLLAPLEANICEVTNGQDALDLSVNKRFDVIITDYQMPVMDGLTFCKTLTERRSSHSIPVVILSDFDSPNIITQGFEAGANVYISKADAQEQLLPAIEKIIQKLRLTRNRKVLIVDDDPHLVAMLTRALSRDGFQTAEASNGIEALSYLTKNKVDLILCDVEMPEMGWRVTLPDSQRRCSTEIYSLCGYEWQYRT